MCCREQGVAVGSKGGAVGSRGDVVEGGGVGGVRWGVARRGLGVGLSRCGKSQPMYNTMKCKLPVGLGGQTMYCVCCPARPQQTAVHSVVRVGRQAQLDRLGRPPVTHTRPPVTLTPPPLPHVATTVCASDRLLLDMLVSASLMVAPLVTRLNTTPREPLPGLLWRP